MKEFSEIFEEIVNRIDCTLNIESINGNEYIVCGGVKWARAGKSVKGYDINGDLKSKKILSVTDKSIFLADNEIVRDLMLNAPTSICGTKMATNFEWTQKDLNLLNKTPLIWLLDNFIETEYGSENSIERDIDTTIFFLDETNIKDFFTKEHKSEVVQPMINLSEEFIKAIKKWRVFKTPDLHERKDLTKFGTETNEGFKKNILDANLSGTFVKLKLKKYKESNFCNC